MPHGVVKFKASEHGLHYLDMAKQQKFFHHMLVTATSDPDDKDKSEDRSIDDLVMVTIYQA